MSTSGIHGKLLEVTVVSGNKLKDTEWISRQDPYVCLEYGTQKFRTRTCTDGGKNPSFQEKFTVSLIEGLREITVNVWNSNTLTYDDFIGGGKVQLNEVLSDGCNDSLWSLKTKSGRHAGEVHLIMHYEGAKASDVEKVVMMRALTRADCIDKRPHKIFLSAREELLTLLPSIKKHGKGIVEPQHLFVDIKANRTEDSTALELIREAVVSPSGVAFALLQEDEAWGFILVDDSLDVVEALKESDYSKFRRESMNGSVGAEDFLQQVEESLEAVIQHVVENPVEVLQSGSNDRRQLKGKVAPPVIKKSKQ